MTQETEEKPPITLKPRRLWSQGNPAINEYCPQCRTNTLPSRRHTCLWCDSPTIQRTGR
jgi:hypothetical protein